MLFHPPTPTYAPLLHPTSILRPLIARLVVSDDGADTDLDSCSILSSTTIPLLWLQIIHSFRVGQQQPTVRLNNLSTTSASLHNPDS